MPCCSTPTLRPSNLWMGSISSARAGQVIIDRGHVERPFRPGDAATGRKGGDEGFAFSGSHPARPPWNRCRRSELNISAASGGRRAGHGYQDRTPGENGVQDLSPPRPRPRRVRPRLRNSGVGELLELPSQYRIQARLAERPSRNDRRQGRPGEPGSRSTSQPADVFVSALASSTTGSAGTKAGAGISVTGFMNPNSWMAPGASACQSSIHEDPAMPKRYCRDKKGHTEA